MNRLAGSIALAASLLTAAPPAWAGFTVPANAPGQYAPRDECAQLPGAAPFLARLKAAVRKRDAAAFAALTSPEIILDFGGGGGREAVIERLGPGSKLWGELDRILALGCALDAETGGLVMPWFFAQDLGDADPYSTNVTLGAAVPLRERPSRKGKLVTLLNWQLVVIREIEAADPGYETVAVIESDFEGHVRSGKLRSQLDYRLVVEKTGDEWLVTAFLAGD